MKLLLLLLLFCSGCISPQWERCHYCHEDKEPSHEAWRYQDLGGGLVKQRHIQEWTKILREIKKTEYEEVK